MMHAGQPLAPHDLATAWALEPAIVLSVGAAPVSMEISPKMEPPPSVPSVLRSFSPAKLSAAMTAQTMIGTIRKKVANWYSSR